LEGFNPGANYFERNQKKKRGDTTEIKGRFDAYLKGEKRSDPGRPNTAPLSTPFRIGPRI
jgi:hypothetical protein